MTNKLHIINNSTLLANLINTTLVVCVAIIQTLLWCLSYDFQVCFVNITEQKTAGCGIFCIFPWLGGFGLAILYNFVILC